jgi:small-conductance mechanosensitive channel
MSLTIKSRHRLVTAGLLLLALIALVGVVLTRPSAELARQERQRRPPAVDEQPLQTARSMAVLASSHEEQRYAQQALKLADHEVDLAFAYEMSDAREHPAPPTPETRELYTRVSRAQSQLQKDQDLLAELKKLSAAKGAHADAAQQQLDLLEAQQELDEDELDDAKEDLMRSGVDRLSRVQRQFARYQAAAQQNDPAHFQVAGNALDSSVPANLVAQFNAWRTQRGKTAALEQARDEALRSSEELKQKHDEREKQTASVAAASPAPAPDRAATAQNAPDSSQSAIASLRRLSSYQKDLAALDKRVQDEQELGTVYTSWTTLAQTQQQSHLHGMLQSALWIILIALAVYLAGLAADRLLPEAFHEHTRLRTLRLILRFSIQLIGVLLILLVIFGAPTQTPTIIGLATAGITVALKDFIVAFVGWFVLIGRNGVRVGDWVEINGVVGEVAEITLMRTVLLETGNWTDTGHPTGRKVTFMNSYAIEGHYFNFSTAGQWLWDEIEMTIPADRDPYPVLDAVQKVVAKETEANVQAAEQEWRRATSRYGAHSISAAPAVNLRPTGAGVDVHVRYITQANQRFAMRARIYQSLVDLLHRKQVPEARTDTVPAV